MKPKFPSFHSDLKPDKRAEKILQDYIDRSGVTLKKQYGNKACYTPATDTITVPEISQYDDVSEYYSTAYHEAVHSTGHPSRLNRITDTV